MNTIPYHSKVRGVFFSYTPFNPMAYSTGYSILNQTQFVFIIPDVCQFGIAKNAI